MTGVMWGRGLGTRLGTSVRGQARLGKWVRGQARFSTWVRGQARLGRWVRGQARLGRWLELGVYICIIVAQSWVSKI